MRNDLNSGVLCGESERCCTTLLGRDKAINAEAAAAAATSAELLSRPSCLVVNQRATYRAAALVLQTLGVGRRSRGLKVCRLCDGGGCSTFNLSAEVRDEKRLYEHINENKAGEELSSSKSQQ